jgi:hypothetical protein
MIRSSGFIVIALGTMLFVGIGYIVCKIFCEQIDWKTKR